MVQVKKIRVCGDLKVYMNDESLSQPERSSCWEDDTEDVNDQTVELQTELLQEIAA
ncbi:MAG TPA: hypothetical protein V6C69_16375 [Trichormus sp.]